MFKSAYNAAHPLQDIDECHRASSDMLRKG